MSVFEAPILGIPVTIRSGHPVLHAMATSSFGDWNSLAVWPELIEQRSVTVTIDVDERLRDAGPLVYEMQGPSVLVLRDGNCRGRADAVKRTAEVLVGPDLLAAREQLRYTVLEAAVLFLLTGPNRHPVHASALMRDGCAVLLAGPSGVGKSTLAWTARGAGWDVLSDDIVYVQSDPVWRVWGGGGTRSYFAIGAEKMLFELAGLRPELRAGGKIKYALPRAMPMPPCTSRAAVCLLSRDAGKARAVKVTPEAALAALTRWQEPGFDVFVEGREERLAPLAAHAWRLRLGDHPGEAVPLLDEVCRAI